MYTPQKTAVCLLAGLAAVVVQAKVVVENLTATQRLGSKLVDISYDVSSTETNRATVSLSVSNGASAVVATHLAGDIGLGVATGTGKTIVWDAGADWNGNIAVLYFHVEADDGVSEANMVSIPAGTNDVADLDFGDYSLRVDAFFMEATEVTKAQWDRVYSWAVTNGYSFENAGSGKASSHPVHSVSWYDCVKWCNARSEKEGRSPCYTVGNEVYKTGEGRHPACNFTANGYRLPTNDEWEYVARGGLAGGRFPWGDMIAHDNANYCGVNWPGHDADQAYGFHPDYEVGGYPYTSPVGQFAANGYGMHDMAGNVWEWCWDTQESYRNVRGGSWFDSGFHARSSLEYWFPLDRGAFNIGLRTVCR